MISQKNRLSSYLFLSILAHLFLLLFFVSIYTYKNRDDKKLKRLLQTYVYSTNSNQKMAKKIAKNQGKINYKSMLIAHNTVGSKNKFHSRFKSMQNHVRYEIKNDNDNQLLKILHDEIAVKQVYPENAVTLKQTGTAKIRFLLHPNGQITHILVLQSSGFSSLDAAASASVQSISPVGEAHAYLTIARFFSLDIIFE